ncbi:carboxypeptidase regulatory-like domain-containing protein [Aeromicrobium sp. CF4.19]|uniref:carboxypeptidase-like regulatory domain-containing protein n=1 Tax=Aeromicrobium sp. CF4.19 TaxID=3373082 RepID=UPI003EE49624
MRRLAASVLTASMVATTALAGAAPATADTTGHWSDIEFVFDDADRQSTGQVVATEVLGFPDAQVLSDTAGPARVAVGGSTWLGEATDPGAVYGTSRDRPYLSLRPAANNPQSPSTTTYTFEEPTPAQGWTFVLGDIDSEFLDVAATGPDGQPVALSDLGFRGGFNYCAAPPRPGTSVCGTDDSERPVPSWDGTTGRLETTSDVDTNGAAAWFEPTVPISTVTVTSTQRRGNPAYQTWFAALSRDVSGTVAGTPECPVGGLEVVLTAADGTELATTTTADDGTYGFDDVSTYDDHTVTVATPEGCRTVGESTQTADLSETDAVVDVELEAVTGTVGGIVADTDGDPVADVEITVTGPDGSEQTATTDVGGSYEVPVLPPGEYTVTVDPPEGTEVVGGGERVVTIDEDGTDVELDFVLETTDVAPTPPDPSAPEPEAPGAPVGGGSPGPGTASGLPSAGGASAPLLLAGLGLVAVGGLLLASRFRGRATLGR